MWRLLSSNFPSLMRPKRHCARGISVRGAMRESRTVSVLRASSGRATGYSLPPLKPRIKCPSGISSIGLESITSPRSNPVMVWPWSLAIGAYRRKRIAAHHVPLPSQRGHGESVNQQPRVARAFGQVPIAAVHQSDDARPPAIRDLQQHGAIAALHVFWPHHVEVRRKTPLLHFSGSPLCPGQRFAGCAGSQPQPRSRPCR